MPSALATHSGLSFECGECGGVLVPAPNCGGRQKDRLGPSKLFRHLRIGPRETGKANGTKLMALKGRVETYESVASPSDRSSSTGTVVRHGHGCKDNCPPADSPSGEDQDQDQFLRNLLAEKLRDIPREQTPVHKGPRRTVGQIFGKPVAAASHANVEEREKLDHANDASNATPQNDYGSKVVDDGVHDDTPDHEKMLRDLHRLLGLESEPENRSISLDGDHSVKSLPRRHQIQDGGSDKSSFKNGVAPKEVQENSIGQIESPLAGFDFDFASETQPLSPYPKPHDARIPGCTANHDPQNWRITDSMLKAYNAMRGPHVDDVDLLDWMERHARFRKPTKSMAYLWSSDQKLETTDSRFSNDDSSGRSHIEGEAIIVPRATLEHIAPPEGFLPAEHGEPNTNVPGGYLKMLKRNFDENGWSDEPDELIVPMDDRISESSNDEFCISDDEGDPRDGRISPCTFRLWAAGAREWDPDRLKHDENFEKSELSLGVPSFSDYGHNHDNTNAARNEEPKTHEESDTDVSWEPLTYGQQERVEKWQENAEFFGEIAKASRQNISRPAYDAALDAPDTFSEVEVRAALSAVNAPDVYGVPARHAEQAIDEGWEAYHREKQVETKLRIARVSAEARLHRRLDQLQRVKDSVANILHRQDHDDKHRLGEIYRGVGQHIKDVEDLYGTKVHNCGKLKRQLEDLLEQEREVEARVREEARKVGVRGDDDLGLIERAVHVLNDEALGGDETSFF